MAVDPTIIEIVERGPAGPAGAPGGGSIARKKETPTLGQTQFTLDSEPVSIDAIWITTARLTLVREEDYNVSGPTNQIIDLTANAPILTPSDYLELKWMPA